MSQHGTKAFPGHGQPIEAELARLRRENEVLKRERDILKQATFFRPTSSLKLSEVSDQTAICYQFMLSH